MGRRMVHADPYWITCRQPDKCRGCKAPIKKGDRAFYYPKGRFLYGKRCGCADECARDFQAAIDDDERAYNTF